jgi:hypothetical protein
MNPSRRTRSQILRAMHGKMKAAERRADLAEARTRALMHVDVEHVPWDHLRMFQVKVAVDVGAFRYHPQEFVDQLVKELPQKLLHEFHQASF